jgi:hypothetical protein
MITAQKPPDSLTGRRAGARAKRRLSGRPFFPELRLGQNHCRDVLSARPWCDLLHEPRSEAARSAAARAGGRSAAAGRDCSLSERQGLTECESEPDDA